MNRIILMGRLTRDPEVRYSSGNPPLAVAKYAIAVDRRFKKEGQPGTDFFNCVAFGKAGEFAEKYFKKGQMVAVSGRLEMSEYDDKTGQKRTWVEVAIDEQHFAESRASFEARSSREGNTQNSYSGPDSGPEPSGFMPIEESVDDDDLPF